jgi:hypothetical protein
MIRRRIDLTLKERKGFVEKASELGVVGICVRMRGSGCLESLSLLVSVFYLSRLSSRAELGQKYSLYSEVNCGGESETFLSSTRHLNHHNASKLVYYGRAKSRRIHSGL